MVVYGDRDDWDHDHGPGGLTVAVMVLVAFKGTERMPGQGTAIRPTSFDPGYGCVRALAIRIPLPHVRGGRQGRLSQ
jgi:hypothetical protein